MDIIDINDFDWNYYLDNNIDVKKSIKNTKENSYSHWLRYGIYENRIVKKNDDIEGFKILVKKKNTTNYKSKINYNNIPIPTNNINNNIIKHSKEILHCKIAILIHIYNLNIFNHIIKYINHLSKKYDDSNILIYINICEKGETDILPYKSLILNKNVHYIYNSINKGGDIGGFLILIKELMKSMCDFDYFMFIHTKTNISWRKDLCNHIFNYPLHKLEKDSNIGIVGSKNRIYKFSKKNVEEYNKFKLHIDKLCNLHNINIDDHVDWSFVGGTIFLGNINIVKYIYNNNIDEVYNILNDVESIDLNWANIVKNKYNVVDVGNDYKYRLLHNKSLLSNYMVEHTYERIIGLICKHLNLKLIS